MERFFYLIYSPINSTTMKYQPYPHLVRRFIAGLIDYSLMYLITLILVYTIGSPNNEGGYSLTGLNCFVPVFFWFVLIVITEQIFGSTIGNGVVGLKPLSIEGRPGKPHVFQSLKRHILDPVDMFLFGIVAIIAIKNTPKNQRLGDLWAKTIVIKDVPQE